MSELINNSTMRQEQLKSLIRQLHEGMPLQEAKSLFKKDFGTVSTEEIVALEQALIEEGMPVSDVQRLCDVHAALFGGSIEEIHKPKDPTEIAGHPAQVLREENERIVRVIEDEIEPFLNKTDDMSYLRLRIGIERLMEVSKHYARKEHLLFPPLERRGITSVPQVMWGVDNAIREKLRAIKVFLDGNTTDTAELAAQVLDAMTGVRDMVTKENSILLPKLIETLTDSEWIEVDQGSNEIGYFLEGPPVAWKSGARALPVLETEPATSSEGEVRLDAGKLNPVELNAILNTVPFDMTFVDKDGYVRYFTQGRKRIFERPKAILGRHVTMCHPPKSVHVVEGIIDSFRTGKKDHEDFHIQAKGMFVHIRYYAVRDKDGEYLGTVEVTQDIKTLRELEGEKRLVSDG